MLGPQGPLDGMERLRSPGNAGVLSHLAEIDARRAVDCIRRALDSVPDMATVRDEIRWDLVEAIEKIAFLPETFVDAASLMLRLAVNETEHHISNNATGRFAALFPVLGGATAADGASRKTLLRDAAKTIDPRQRTVVVGALRQGAETTYFSRFVVGAETHGSRPALEPWRPDNTEEASEYVSFCVELLAEEAACDDDVGVEARAELGHELRVLTSSGLVDLVETVVGRVVDAVGSWPEAIESIGNFLRFDAAGMPEEVVVRARDMIQRLQPATLSDRIRGLVSNMPWDYPNGEDIEYDDQARRQLDTVRAIAEEALHDLPVLAENLPQLCSGSQRWAGVFGEYVGARVETPGDWFRRIETALRGTPDEGRNFDLLSGFLKGLSERDADPWRPSRERSPNQSIWRGPCPGSAHALESLKRTFDWLSMACGRALCRPGRCGNGAPAAFFRPYRPRHSPCYSTNSEGNTASTVCWLSWS